VKAKLHTHKKYRSKSIFRSGQYLIPSYMIFNCCCNVYTMIKVDKFFSPFWSYGETFVLALLMCTISQQYNCVSFVLIIEYDIAFSFFHITLMICNGKDWTCLWERTHADFVLIHIVTKIEDRSPQWILFTSLYVRHFLSSICVYCLHPFHLYWSGYNLKIW